jgi:hypothetical protein
MWGMKKINKKYVGESYTTFSTRVLVNIRN